MKAGPSATWRVSSITNLQIYIVLSNVKVLVCDIYIKYKCYKSDPSNALATSPQSFRYKEPIGKREDESLHQVKHEPGFFLIIEEGFINNSVVFELSQQELSLSGEKRATGVSSI